MNSMAPVHKVDWDANRNHRHILNKGNLVFYLSVLLIVGYTVNDIAPSNIIHKYKFYMLLKIIGPFLYLSVFKCYSNESFIIPGGAM